MHTEVVFETLIVLIPIFLIAFMLRWIRIIAVNSNIQIEQNKEMIELLKQNIRDKEEIKVKE